MSPELIGFLSSGASGMVAILVCVVNNYYQNNKMTALIEYRLSELEKKVEKHNKIIERTYNLERDTAVQEERIAALEKKII